MNQREYMTILKMKDYLLDIKDFLTESNVNNLSEFLEVKDRMCGRAVIQTITNIVELNKVLEDKLIPKYVIRTRNIASHSYDSLDFKTIWRFIEGDLDRIIVEIDKMLLECKGSEN